MGDLPLARDTKNWTARLAQKSEQHGYSVPNGNQRSPIYRLGAKEDLVYQATIAMILYSNRNFPNLKSEHPIWTDRVKQIAKTWKSFPNEQGQAYV